MLEKIIKLIVVTALMLLTCNSIIAQSKTMTFDEEQKVRAFIADFNRTVFKESDVIEAIKTHYYTEEPDEIDSRSEVNADFARFTRKAADKDKLRHFAMKFYFENWVQLLHWKLGTETVSDKTKFVDYEMAEDKKLINLWINALKENGITEEQLEEVGSVIKNLDFGKRLYGIWNTVLAKNIDRNLLDKNLRFIDKHTIIKKIFVENREYFEVENKLFSYTIGFKNGTPKIMRINRN